MKRTEPKSFALIFDEAMERVGAKSVMASRKASYMWPEVVGPGVARYTVKRYLADNGVLHVYISSAPLRQELVYMRRSIIDRLNEAAGSPEAITDIVFH